jgi:hypothetical protein
LKNSGRFLRTNSRFFKADCKGKGLYFPTQIFLDFIFKFLEIYLSFLPSKNCCFLKADCKGKGTYLDTKIILANSY